MIVDSKWSYNKIVSFLWFSNKTLKSNFRFWSDLVAIFIDYFHWKLKLLTKTIPLRTFEIKFLKIWIWTFVGRPSSGASMAIYLTRLTKTKNKNWPWQWMEKYQNLLSFIKPKEKDSQKHFLENKRGFSLDGWKSK